MENKHIIKRKHVDEYFKSTCCGNKVKWTKKLSEAFEFNSATGLNFRIIELRQSGHNVEVYRHEQQSL